VSFVQDMLPTGRIKPVGYGPGESLFQKCSCVFRTSYLYLEFIEVICSPAEYRSLAYIKYVLNR